MDRDRVASVAVVASTWDHHETVGELPRVHLYRGATHTAWTVANLPNTTPSTTIVDVFPLDPRGQHALALTDREGYFRTSDGGVKWQSANFDEPRLQNGRAVKTIIVGTDVYSLAILNKNPGDDDNPLFRLARRTWLQRWRIGVGRWLSGDER
jgi:hypothetical protein